MNLIVNRLFRVSDDSDDHDRFRYTIHIFPCHCNRDSSTINNVESTVIINSKLNFFSMGFLFKHKKRSLNSQLSSSLNAAKLLLSHSIY